MSLTDCRCVYMWVGRYLRKGLSNLKAPWNFAWPQLFLWQKLKYCYSNSLNPACSCGLDNESIWHYIFFCQKLVNEITTLWNNLLIFNEDILNNNNVTIVRLLLFGDQPWNGSTNIRNQWNQWWNQFWWGEGSFKLTGFNEVNQWG